MANIAVEIVSPTEYSIFVDGDLLGAYFFGEGIVFPHSEGIPLSLDDLKEIIARLEDLRTPSPIVMASTSVSPKPPNL